MRFAGLFVTFFFSLGVCQAADKTSSAAAATTFQSSLATPFDSIPDFDANSTIRSVANAAWSSPATWNLGRAPNASDIVFISPNTTVTVDDETAVAHAVGIQDRGRVLFRTDANTRLTVVTLLVREGGELQIGSASQPVSAAVRAAVVFADVPLDTTDDGQGVFDPQQYGNGLVALGKVTLHGAAKNPTFVRLAAEPRAQNTTLALSQVPTGWRSGDALFLPMTEPIGPCCYTFAIEQRSAAGDVTGPTLALNAALDHDHPGGYDGAGNVTFLPHVGNLTRNVVIRSANPNGTRGHTFFTYRADVDIRYVEFKDLGRTARGPLDNSVFMGTVWRIGTNQIGRYAFHAHHLWGPRNSSDPNYQYTLVGNSVHDGRKWGMAIHDSHYGLIRDNVLFRFQNDGFATEDGSESYNLFDRNFVAWTDGSGFWLSGMRNTFRENVAANFFIRFDLPDDENGGGAGFFGVRNLDANLQLPVPRFRGADLRIPAERELLPWVDMTFLDFFGNESYGARAGVWLDHRHGGRSQGGHHIRNFRAWAMQVGGGQTYDTDGVIFDGYVGRDAGIFINSDGNPIVVRNADIQGREENSQGIWFVGALKDLFVENSYFRNTENVIFHLMSSAGVGPIDENIWKRTILRNVRLEAPAGRPLQAISMKYLTWEVSSLTPVLPSSMYVFDFNGQPGDNFRVYFTEQHPDFIVPFEGDIDAPPDYVRRGCPERGLTNTQCWSRHNRAVAASIAPCATARAGISGYACPLGRRGDLNRDNSVNALDAVLLANNLVGNFSPGTGDFLYAADCNGDENINVLDHVLLLNYLAGNVPSL